MQAAIMHGLGLPLDIEDVTPEPPGANDIVVSVEAAGVCHSDISGLRGYLGLENPTILGHEVAGVVTEVGADVRGLRVGDRIIGSLVPHCKQCFWCLRGQSHLCAETWSVRGVTRARTASGDAVTSMLGLGAFAEQMVMDSRLAVKVDSDLPAEQLALIGCGISTGAGAALWTAKVQPGSTVAVIGCGGVGQSLIQGARIAGAARIIAVDPTPFKREVSLRNGATDTVDPGQGPTAEQVKDLTSGRGVDYAFEVVGRMQTVTDAYESARRGGEVITVGIPSPDARIDLPATDFFRAEKSIVGSYYGSTQVASGFQVFADLIAAGRFDAEGLITHRYGLGDLARAFDELEAGEVIRGVVTF
ncbi:Zn-dependent alcohol dehydrogenase [Naasia aerilata]|uniref:Alcohol dehydrogenase n=1 Tax=Naasia aerilata TaxID=1162966 RepID=A0ABM8GD63_9MICO|nr:Zn-dependent alcohol dehydrogenase [Naasia aerilata]BDZ46206.1 alcohol dehydrogenase [Naasia aerilata]